ncbi:MAG: hypothetical protein ACJ74O_11290 [Frankiaceae bacterium]
MTSDSHDPAGLPGCPWWCSDRFGDPADHPARHTGHSLAVEAERPNGIPTTLHALLALSLGGSVVRVLLGDVDTDLLTLSSAASRSLAAMLVRLADVAERIIV